MTVTHLNCLVKVKCSYKEERDELLNKDCEDFRIIPEDVIDAKGALTKL